MFCTFSDFYSERHFVWSSHCRGKLLWLKKKNTNHDVSKLEALSRWSSSSAQRWLSRRLLAQISTTSQILCLSLLIFPSRVILLYSQELPWAFASRKSNTPLIIHSVLGVDAFNQLHSSWWRTFIFKETRFRPAICAHRFPSMDTLSFLPLLTGNNRINYIENHPNQLSTLIISPPQKTKFSINTFIFKKICF